MTKRERLIEKRRAYLEEQGKEWVKVHVEADMQGWLLKHPVPDEDESGLQAIEQHEAWYSEVYEQMEEEDAADSMISRYKLFGSDPKGLYALDQEYAARVYTAPSLALN